MANIYDVAKLAGVSIGTVSNYLNQKYVGAARSEAIRAAIDALHYTPNHVARSLKAQRAPQLTMVLPNLSEGTYATLAETVVHDMNACGYQVTLAFSDNSPAEEKRILNGCFSSMCAGVLLCTCNPDDTEIFQSLQREKPLIFLLRQPNGVSEFSYFGFDNYDIAARLTRALIEQGEQHIGLWTGPLEFSSERACVKGYREAMAAAAIDVDAASIVALPVSRELIFRQATTMFFSGKYPRFMLASSRLIADALIEAAYYQNIILNQNVCILSLGEGKWNNADQLYFSFSTDRSVKGLAQEACQFLQECLRTPQTHEYRIRQLRDDFSMLRLGGVLRALQRPAPVRRSAAPAEHLRIVSPDIDTGALSIRQLVPWISERTGIDIDLELLPVYDIVPMVMEEQKRGDCGYDLVHLDNSWMAQMAEAGIIRDITDYYASRPLLLNAIVPNLIDATATVHGRIYGAPSLLCSQMMFYRRDLFENPVLQNSFSESYHRPLKPPESWFEYLLVAGFFTRSVNPASPCQYGVVMATRDPEMMLTEVFPRIWSYGGRIYDDYGNVVLYSEENVQAIRNYISCVRFSPPEYESWLLPQLPTIFSEGNAAMMIGYDIHACNMLNYGRSKVMDKIGYAAVPGGISTMGGWNYCINVKSPRTEQCYRFLDYLLSPELAIPYTLLGGGSPRKNVVNRPEVISMYPWMQYTDSTFQCSRQRKVTPSLDHINPTEIETERVLADMVHRSIREPNRLKEFLHEADRQLNAMRRPR